MYQRDYKDIIGGSLLLASGLLIAWHAANTLEFGTISQMGPGMFPMSIGLLLAAFGAAIMIPALFRGGEFEKIEWRPAIAVLASIAVFAATVRWLGLLPAILLQITVSRLADTTFRPRATAAMVIVLPLAAYVIFSLGLGLPIGMIRWPF